MATIRKRKDKYVVIYDYINEKGERKQKWETCESKAEANKRAKEVEYAKLHDTFIPPSNQTVAEFLAMWAPIQAKQKWQYNLNYIRLRCQRRKRTRRVIMPVR